MALAALGWLVVGATATPGDDRPRDPSGSASPAEVPDIPSGPQRHILLLYPESRLLPAIAVFDQAVRTALQARVPGPVYFYTEYLDLSLFDGDEPQRELRQLFARKYARRAIDLIIPADSRTLRIALHNRADLFGGAPIVFAAVDPTAAASLKLAPDVTGTWLTLDWAGTLEAALHLQPQARRALVVNGSSSGVDRVWLTAARKQLAPFQDRLEITYLTERTLDDVLAAVAALPAHTVLLVGAFQRDAAGRNFLTGDAVARIAAAASVPTYALADTLVGRGTVGGRVVSFEALGVKTAELAAQVLQGARPPPSGEGTNVHVFDWRQLRRWGLDERRLPVGSVLRFRPPSAWVLYRWYIVGGGTLVALQSALIAALLVHRARRRRAERALGERLRFETLLSELSATFVALPADEVGRQIERALGQIAVALDLDRATLGALLEGERGVRVAHAWSRPGVAPLPASLGAREFPWIEWHLRRRHPVSFSRLEELPEEAEVDRRTFLALGTRSLVAVPLEVGGAPVGVLAFAALRAHRDWPGDLIQRLRLLGEILANALARQRAERAVRESEERFRRMADGAPIMVWLSDPAGRRTYVNARWLDLAGRRLEDERGDGWTLRLHPDDREAGLKAMAEALALREPFTVEYRLRAADGQYRWVLDHGLPRRDEGGAFAGYVGSAIDVTELKTAQQALAESHALRSAVFGSLYGRVVAIDRDGVILAVNHSWSRFAEERGATGGSLSVGDNYLDACRRAAAHGEPEAGRILEAILAVLRGHAEHTSLEYAHPLPTEVRWYEMTVEPFRRPEGGAVVGHVDITRRHQAEDEARRQREELAHVLRVATLGELATSLAHEINQPLAAILSNAQAGRRVLEAGPPASAELREVLADITDDARRAAQVIRRLHALSRKEVAERRPIDVNALVTDVVRLLRADLQRRHIAIRLARAEGLPALRGDPVLLQQVVLNALINAGEAIDAAAGGPRRITIETGEPEPGWLEIAVSDTGGGVPAGDRERIFEPFTSSKPRGLGMGLAIGRSIVHAHGGRIWATDNADGGLTLRVALPCAGGDPQA
jgi:PAS domain S-box-containing protein